jgi:hypothetical protein
MKAAPKPLQKATTFAGLLGPDFEGDIFAALVGDDPLGKLLDLEKVGRIHGCGGFGHGLWTFGSTESAEGARSLVGSKPRAQLHAKAASAIAKHLGDRRTEAEPALAWQYREAGNRTGFADTLKRAGHRAKELGFPAEAEACFRQVLGIPGPTDLPKVNVMLEISEVLSELGRAGDAISQLESALKSKVMRVPRKKKQSDVL